MKRVFCVGLFIVLFAASASTMEPIDPLSVVVCEHQDFVGPCQTFVIEPWMRHKLVPTLGAFNDKMSSVRVGTAISVRLFQDTNFEGASFETKADVATLKSHKYLSNAAFNTYSNFNDVASSLVVIADGRHQSGGGVWLGSRINLDGQPEMAFFPLPERASEQVIKYAKIGSNVNDEADCLGLEAGVTADIFEHTGFLGQKTRLPGLTSAGTGPAPGCKGVHGRSFDLAPYKMSEKISSLIIYADKKSHTSDADTVVISEHVDHVGASRRYRLEPGMRYKLVPSLGGLNDSTSSLIVGDNVTVHAFQHANFVGHNIEYTSDTQAVDSWWSERISSLIVAPRGAQLEGAQLSALFQSPQFFPLPELLTESETRYPAIHDDLNNESEALVICGEHVSVTLYRNGDFKGEPRDFPGLGPKPNPCVTYGLDDFKFDEVASSLIIRTRSVAPTLVEPHIPLPTPQRGGSDAGTGTKHKAPPVVPKMKLQATEIGSVTLELNTNRQGHDYRDFDLRKPIPEACQEECRKDPRCRAFTYIKPGIQGDFARCWLKDSVPPAEPAPCCASGVKQ